MHSPKKQPTSPYLTELGPEYFWLEMRYSLARWLFQRHSKEDQEQSGKKMLLDLGCGPGNCLRGLPQSVQCLGTDIELSALRIARAVSFAHVLQSDLASLPLASEIADYATLIDVAEHIEDDLALFGETFRVLKPGGLVILTTPAYQFLWGKHDELVGHYRRYNMKGLVSRLEQAGFGIVEKRYLLPVSFFALLGLRMMKRLRKSSNDDFFSLSPFLNSLAKTYLFAECTLSRFFPPPWGLIICVVAQKPNALPSS